MKELRLSRGKVAIVDDDLFDVLNQWKWTYGSNGYAYRFTNKERKHVLLHRLVAEAPKDKIVDHINGDRLDNRSCNLRLCTRKQNNQNRRVVRSKSGYLGVTWSNQNKKWYACLSANGKTISLGFYSDIRDAVKARIDGERKYYGEFAPSRSVA